MEEKRKRVAKTSQEQYEIYCSFLASHSEMTKKKDSDLSIAPAWVELTKLLNGAGGGPIKTEKLWQKVKITFFFNFLFIYLFHKFLQTFENWRNMLRHKKRLEEAERNRTGGGAEVPTKLKDLELKALSLWGNIAIKGALPSNAETGYGELPPAEIDLEIEQQLSILDGPTDEVSLGDMTSTEDVPLKQTAKKRKKSEAKGETIFIRFL